MMPPSSSRTSIPATSPATSLLPAADAQEIGHDCTNWTPAVFYDLMRLGDGTGVRAWLAWRAAWRAFRE